MSAALRLAALLARFRFRHLWNAFLHSRRSRRLRLVAFLGVVAPVAYAALFVQAFANVESLATPREATAALAVVAGAIVLAGLAAKAASSDATLAGSPENELLLTRPVALETLVLARCLAGAATDLFGALFLFPVLVAAAIAWELGAAAYLAAAATSVTVQIGVLACAQAVQIAIVRFVPARRRRAVWVALSLASAATMAALWMVGASILRAPETFILRLKGASHLVLSSPAGLISAPLAVLRDGGGAWAAAVALLATCAVTAAAVATAWLVSRHAGMHGWEEAGAPWAEVSAGPGRADRPGRRPPRPLTMTTKDLRLIVRDRSRLVTLLALPIIFIGVQTFGAAGWSWSTGSVQRVALLTFSLCAYMATLGPLAHMQAERHSFWILRSVPVSMGRLMAGKARAWSGILAAVAAVTFVGLVAGVPGATPGEVVGFGALVVGGIVGVACLAIAVACDTADLTDPQRAAVGPGTVYLFLLVSGLFNVVIAGEAEARVRGVLLYAFAVYAYWLTGMERATECLDPEARRQRSVRPGDGAAFALVLYLGQRVTEAAVVATAGPAADAAPAAGAFILAVGFAAAVYLLRRPSPRRKSGASAIARWSLPASLLGIALAAGAAGMAARAVGRQTVAAPPFEIEFLLMAAAAVLIEELVFRGIIHRALAERWSRHPQGRLLALVLATGAAIAATVSWSGGRLAVIQVMVAALVYHLTGRLSAAWLSRAAFLAGAAL